MRVLKLFLLSILLSGCATVVPWSTANVIPEKVAEGLYRGPRPDFLEVRNTALGINVIISLEEGPNTVLQQEKDYTESHGMVFINLPMSESDPPKPEYLRYIASMIESNRSNVVYVHCRRGIDRTGYAVAAWQVLYADWDTKRAYKEILNHGHSELWFWDWKPSLLNLKGELK